MILISFLLRASRGLVILVILAGLVAGISNTGLLVLINAALNNTTSSRSSLALAFVALCILMVSSRFASQALLVNLSQKAIFKLRMQLSRQILHAPLRHLEELGTPRLMAALTEDIPVIANAIVTIPVLCMHVAIVAACLVYLGWLSGILLLGVLVMLLIGVVTYRMPMMRGLKHIRLGREQASALYKHFRALTEGAKELKLHRQRREAFLSQTLKSTADSLRRYNITGNIIFTTAASWGHLLIFLFIGLLYFVLPTVKEIDAKTLTGYTLAILYVMTPLDVILNTLPILGRANIAMQKVTEVGLSLTNHLDADDSYLHQPESEALWESLEVVGVKHSYYHENDERNFILGPIDLSFRPCELVFLVGGNGSGKTTFAKLLMGLYTPEAGEIRLDGKPVSDATRESYRQLFSVVFSDFYLFENFPGLNLAKMGTRVRDYLVRLQLDHKVHIKDGMLSTTDLSQGQRKRLALLTAYLEDRSFYVFDEWAADQDPLFKEVFYFQLLPELKARGKTVLVITHDDRFYHMADRVIKLNDGKVSYDQPAYFEAAEYHPIADS